jgi:hypothetical protein
MHAPYLVSFQVDMNNGEVEMLAHKLRIGDLAMYGSCQVRINSSKLRGIAAPHYNVSCTDYNHEHRKEWGTLTSYELLRPIVKATCPECERTNISEALKCRDCDPEVGA